MDKQIFSDFIVAKEKFNKMNFLQLTEEKLDVNKVTDLVSHESCGAVSIFVGITRDNFEDKQVIE